MKSTILWALLVSAAVHLHGCSFPTAQMYAGDPFLESATPHSRTPQFPEAAGRALVAKPAEPFDPTRNSAVASAENPFPTGTPPISSPVAAAPAAGVQLPAENPEIQTHTAVAEPPVIAASAVAAAKPTGISQWRPSHKSEAPAK